MTLASQEFYEIMKSFENYAKKNLRSGSNGFEKENKDNWNKQHYYVDGQTNEYFKIFFSGVSLGKII